MQLPLATVAISNCCQQISWHQNIFLLIVQKKNLKARYPPPPFSYLYYSAQFYFLFYFINFFPLKACEVKLHWGLVAYLITYISMHLKLALGNIKYMIRFLYSVFIRFSDFVLGCMEVIIKLWS